MQQTYTKVKRHGGQLLKRTCAPLWRYAFNGPALRDYARRPPALSEEARRVAADLERDGVAVSSLEALTGDPHLLGRLREQAHALERENETLIAEQRARLDTGVRKDTWDKPFVVELLDHRRPVIEPDGLLAQASLHPQLRGVADAYYGLRTRVSDINFWRSLTSSRPPESSQLWHRDIADDFYVLKLFVYLEDVDHDTGPFTYLRGSHRKGDLRDLQLPAEHDGQNLRSGDDAPARVGAGDRVRSYTGPAGTVVFADTLGYHRGGWARRSPRLLLQVLYASHAAVPKRLLGAPPGIEPAAWRRDLAYAA